MKADDRRQPVLISGTLRNRARISDSTEEHDEIRLRVNDQNDSMTPSINFDHGQQSSTQPLNGKRLRTTRRRNAETRSTAARLRRFTWTANSWVFTSAAGRHSLPPNQPPVDDQPTTHLFEYDFRRRIRSAEQLETARTALPETGFMRRQRIPPARRKWAAWTRLPLPTFHRFG